MLVSNTETIAGYTIQELKGLVQGNTVRAKHAGRDIAASFKNFVGGELKGYTELLTESRREAMTRMLAQAQELGANAVVNVRFTTSAVTSGPLDRSTDQSAGSAIWRAASCSPAAASRCHCRSSECVATMNSADGGRRQWPAAATLAGP